MTRTFIQNENGGTMRNGGTDAASTPSVWTITLVRYFGVTLSLLVLIETIAKHADSGNIGSVIPAMRHPVIVALLVVLCGVQGAASFALLKARKVSELTRVLSTTLAIVGAISATWLTLVRPDAIFGPIGLYLLPQLFVLAAVRSKP